MIEATPKLNRRQLATRREKQPYGKSTRYTSLHHWVNKKLGKASYCSNDRTHKTRRFEWANISGEYLRDLHDYRPLCVSCHRKQDYTATTYLKRSLLYRGNKRAARAVVQLTPKGRFVRQFESAIAAGKALGVTNSAISNAVRGDTLISAGYRWRYADAPMTEQEKIDEASLWDLQEHEAKEAIQ